MAAGMVLENRSDKINRHRTGVIRLIYPRSKVAEAAIRSVPDNEVAKLFGPFA